MLGDTRRLRFLAVVLAFIAVVLGSWTYLSRTPSLNLQYVRTLPSSTAVAGSLGGDLLEVTGNTFTRQSLATGKITTLDSRDNLGLVNPDSLSTSSSNKYLLFHTNVTPAGTVLASALAAKQYPNEADYWWLFNIDQKIYTPLPGGTLLAKFKGDNIIGLSSNYPGEQLTTYGLTGDAESSVKISNASNFFPTDTGYLLQSTNGKLLFTDRAGIVSRPVGNANNIIGVTSNGEFALTISGQGSQQTIQRVSLKNFSSKQIAKDANGQFAWLPQGMLLYGTGAGRFNFYTVTSGKTVTWGINDLENIRPTQLINDHTAIVSDSTTNYAVSSDVLFNSQAE